MINNAYGEPPHRNKILVYIIQKFVFSQHDHDCIRDRQGCGSSHKREVHWYSALQRPQQVPPAHGELKHPALFRIHNDISIHGRPMLPSRPSAIHPFQLDDAKNDCKLLVWLISHLIGPFWKPFSVQFGPTVVFCPRPLENHIYVWQFAPVRDLHYNIAKRPC